MSIYEFSDEYFKENLNSFIIKDLCLNSLLKVSNYSIINEIFLLCLDYSPYFIKLEINNLVRLVKFMVEKEEILSVHVHVKKMVFDVVIANADKIEKVNDFFK